MPSNGVSIVCEYDFLLIKILSHCNGILCSQINFEMTNLGTLSQGKVEMNESCANIVDLNNMLCQFVRASYVIKEVLAKALSCVFL